MSVRAVFFDFGGTLAEPLVDLRPLVEAASLRTGVRVAWERFRSETDRAWQELWPEAPALLGRLPSFADLVHERALRAAGARGPIDAMVRALREESIAAKWHPPYRETEQVLQLLRRRGLPLYVVSNHTDYLPLILQNLGWSAWFSGVTFSQEVGAEKPDPRVFELALRRASRAPHEVVHVGDRWDADYLGARRCGIPSVWLDRSGSNPSLIGESIADLRGLVSRLTRPGGGGREIIDGVAGSGRTPP